MERRKIVIHKIADDIFGIKVRLVGNPLKNLTSYVFLGAERNLLVDTGFNQQACLDDMRAGIGELELDMENTDIFLTHFHSDHSGLVSKIASPRSRVYISGPDRELLEGNVAHKAAYWDELEQAFLAEGFPKDEAQRSLENSPAKNLSDDKLVELSTVADGDVIPAGQRRFTCVSTPGHTPGHMCLWEEATQTLVLGDHVLFDITPNITAWKTLPNALGHYLASLEKISGFPAKLALPAHREAGEKTLAQRVGELTAHHHSRLEDVRRIVAETPGLTGYEVASQMQWDIRAKNWAEFPPAQKWFAVGEAVSHLDYLIETGAITRQTVGGVHTYLPGA